MHKIAGFGVFLFQKFSKGRHAPGPPRRFSALPKQILVLLATKRAYLYEFLRKTMGIASLCWPRAHFIHSSNTASNASVGCDPGKKLVCFSELLCFSWDFVGLWFKSDKIWKKTFLGWRPANLLSLSLPLSSSSSSNFLSFSKQKSSVLDWEIVNRATRFLQVIKNCHRAWCFIQFVKKSRTVSFSNFSPQASSWATGVSWRLGG